MQSFVILCRSSWVYRAGASAETGTWDGVLAVLNIEIVSTAVFSSWFDPAEASWAFLQEQKFNAIVAELEQVVQTFDKGLIICKMFD